MIGIFYPYLETKTQFGDLTELELSMASVAKYLDEDFEFWIVSQPDCKIKRGRNSSDKSWTILTNSTIGPLDQLPSTTLRERPSTTLPSVSLRKRLRKKYGNKVRFIDHWRDETVYEPAIMDTAEKLRYYIKHPETPEIFIRMYDDLYLLAPRKLTDFTITRKLFDYEELATRLRSGGVIWRAQVLRSIQAVRKLGYRGIMTETHCPEFFEKKKMQTIFKLFEPGINRMVTSSLYYNVYPFDRELKDWKTERALFYGYEDEYSYGPGLIDEKVSGKFYLNHNAAGLDEELYWWIVKKYE